MRDQHTSASERAADVVIIGGGTGGCAAALAACQLGARVILTEPTIWIGGQLTSQAVPPDEHRWIEAEGCTARYREFRALVRDYYWRFYPMARHLRGTEHLNPGGGDVSRLCFEPRVGLAVLEAMLAPWRASGQLLVLTRTEPLDAETQGDRVRAVRVCSLETGTMSVLRAPYFVDATEAGDLLPLTGTEYVVGSESREQTGEPHAPARPNPANQQALTWCFALEHRRGEDHTIARPGDYAFWRDHVPALTPPWPGRLLSWRTTHPITLEPRTLGFNPCGETPPDEYNLWLYRRIVAREHLVDGRTAHDVTIVNWPQNDYMLGPVIDVSGDEARRHLEGAKRLGLALLYWMQTEAPRPDGGTGWPGLRLRGDLLGTEDGFALAPYLRESRRILAEFTILEQHVTTEARWQLLASGEEPARAERFADSVGVGCYRLDLHPSTAGENYLDLSVLPFQIPLGALIPRRVDNLLAAGKNIGTTHITNGCYRLQPIEWNIGEAAGALAAHCVRTGQSPREVRKTPALLADFQHVLEKLGVQLEWGVHEPV